MTDNDHKQALQPGFALGSYRIVRVLGVGGFGVTYLCEHSGLDVQVAVKECLPNEVAVRDGSEVHPKSAGDREGFEWGLSRFLDEARTVARFQHPNVVRVRDCFEANNTAYIVMDYEDGEPLDVLLKRHGTLTEALLRRIVLPLADGLRQVHAAGFLHRDVKPANVFVRRSDESPVLLDFGSARQALGRRSRSVTAIASAGYSPPEQYESTDEQGPWTDIYALSALCHRAITGKVPVEAPRRQNQLLRSQPDPLSNLAEAAIPGYSSAFLEAIDWGLRLVETQRPQSLDAWLARIGAIAEPHEVTPHRLPVSPSNQGAAKLPDRSTRSRIVRLWSGTLKHLRRTTTSLSESNPGRSAQALATPAPQQSLGATEYLRIFLTGGLGLRKTFWLIGAVGSGVLGFALAFIFDFSGPLDKAWLFTPIGPSSTAAAMTDWDHREEVMDWAAILFLWSLLVKVGVWKAASIYSGPRVWAILAKLHTVGDALVAVVLFARLM